MSQLCWLTTLLSLYILEFIDMNFPSKNLHYNTGYYRVDPVFDGNCTILTRYWYAHTATGASAGMSIFVYIWFFVQYTSTHNSHTHFWWVPWAGRKKYIYLLDSQFWQEELRNVTCKSNLDGPVSVHNFHFWILVSIVT